jgi:pimeloyl-ACP methyl ester carboxylesterase
MHLGRNEPWTSRPTPKKSKSSAPLLPEITAEPFSCSATDGAPLGVTPSLRATVRRNTGMLAVFLVDLVEFPSWTEPQRVDDISSPSLVIWGEADTPSIHAVGESLSARIPAAQRVVVPEADHFVPLHQPDVFRHAALSFVHTIVAPATPRRVTKP